MGLGPVPCQKRAKAGTVGGGFELTLRVLVRWDSRLHRCPVVDAEVPVLLEQGYPPWPTSVKS